MNDYMEIPKPSYEELVESLFRQADKIARQQQEIEQLREQIKRLEIDDTRTFLRLEDEIERLHRTRSRGCGS